MLYGKLNEVDIDYILKNISYSSMREVTILNLSLEDVRLKYVKHIGKEFTGVFYDNNKNPQAMIILELKGLNKWVVDLVSVKGAWKKIGTSFTIFLTRMSSDMIERSGGVIEAYSPFSLNKYFNWFEFMGFTLKGKNKNNFYHYTKQMR